MQLPVFDAAGDAGGVLTPAFDKRFWLLGLTALACVCLSQAAERTPAQTVVMGRMQAVPVLDGQLNDWPVEVTTILLGEAAHTLPRAAKWGGARDVSGAVRVAWDESYMYFAADIADDKPLQAAATGAEPWHGDSLELFFNTHPGEQRKTGFWQVALVPPLTAEAKLVVLCPQGEFTGVEGAAVARENGYTLECRIPWTNFPEFAPKTGAGLGFQVMVNDRDSKGRKSQLCWYGSAVTYVQPLDMNVLRLGEHGASFVGGNVLAGPTGAVVTETKQARISVIADVPGATSARVTLAGSEPVVMPLMKSGDRLTVGEGGYAIGDREGTAEFGVEVLDAEGVVRAKTVFKTELAGGRYAAMKEELKTAQARLKALVKADAEAKAGVEFWTQRIAALAANEARPEAVTAGLLKRMLAELKDIAGALDQLERGEDPYAGRTGSFVRAYRSPLTGEWRPHSLFVPKDVKAGEARPLIVMLHGIFGDDRHLFQRLDAVERLGAIVYQAASYRQFDWADVSAAETWAGLEQVMATQMVDRDRVYLIGHHIGGRGVWQLAMARPGVFAALAPLYPGIDTKPPYEALRLYPEFYEQAALGNLIPAPHFKVPRVPEPVSDYQERLRMERLSLVTRADNIAGLPMRLVRGEEQPDAAAERLALVERLKTLGTAVDERHEIGAQHGSVPPELDDPEFYRWLLAQRRAPTPEVYDFVANGLRDNVAWFTRIDALTSPVEPGRVRVVWNGGSPKMRSFGVSAISPVFARARFERWEVDGQDFAAVPLVRGADGLWIEGKAETGIKRHGLSGPIDDFQFERFIYVYGDGSEKAARKLA
ncbi:MAG: sugar-binding protein, partial [Rariglobus sp.]